MIDILCVILFIAGVVTGIKNKRTPHIFILFCTALLFLYYKHYIYHKTLSDIEFIIGSVIINYSIYYLGFILPIIIS